MQVSIPLAQPCNISSSILSNYLLLLDSGMFLRLFIDYICFYLLHVLWLFSLVTILCWLFMLLNLHWLYCLVCLTHQYNCLKYLQETLHTHNCSDESIDDAEALENGNSEAGKDMTTQKNENLLLNWPLMSSIIIYCVFSLHDIAYQEVSLIDLDDVTNGLCISFDICCLDFPDFILFLLNWTTFIHLAFFRFSLYGVLVLESWGVWTSQQMMLAMFFQ